MKKQLPLLLSAIFIVALLLLFDGEIPTLVGIMDIAVVLILIVHLEGMTFFCFFSLESWQLVLL